MIDSFSRGYGFLSNFHPVEVELDGVVYRSVEHAYQAAKTENLAHREWIREAPKAYIAKYRGGMVALRPGWDQMKVGVMLELLRHKFSMPVLRALLLNTGTEELVEGNTWRDTFWGVYNGVGENMLGKLLMQVREEIR